MRLSLQPEPILAAADLAEFQRLVSEVDSELKALVTELKALATKMAALVTEKRLYGYVRLPQLSPRVPQWALLGESDEPWRL